MRIFLILRNQEAIESDKRLPKYNFSLRKNYTIKEAFFKKRLIYDVAMTIQDQAICMVTNLEAYYNY